jgi:hypothetical protein
VVNRPEPENKFKTFKKTGIKMTAAKPYGNLNTASILVIGHDPRLQHGKAETEFVFFLDYLEKFEATPVHAPTKRKYEFAQALVDYISALAGHPVRLDVLYVTNLCNEFLPSTQGQGEIFIPEREAMKGYQDICRIIDQGNFKLIIPTSCQIFYQLCRLGFPDEKDDRIDLFVKQASPKKPKQEMGVYVPAGKAPFLEVCGERFHHNGIPVVPVLHVKQWPIKNQLKKYINPMERARQAIREILN